MIERKIYASYEDLLADAKKAGIKETSLDAAVDTHRLPSPEGEFKSEIGLDLGEKDEKGNVKPSQMAHIQLQCTDGSICSARRIRGQAAFVADPKDFEFVTGAKPETKDNIYLKTTVLNANLPADQARLAMMLAGKKFKATVKKGFIIPFKADKNGKVVTYKNTEAGKAQARNAAVIRDFWTVEVID